MSYQTSTITRIPVSTIPQTTSPHVSQTLVQPIAQSKGLSNKDTAPCLRPVSFHYTLSPASAASDTSGAGDVTLPPVLESAAATGPAPGTVAGKPVITRGYSSHLPRNPNRPPPYTYQRQHEFPPFPPLTQHPVLPFLTTAFPNQSETNPMVAPSPKNRPTIAPRASTTQRHVQANVSTIPTMDVSKNDPTATFIRPPLVVPMLHSVDHKINGTDNEPTPGTPLTYAILHAHRTWFLDAEDFHKDNPNRIDYPPDLEPPRGWAPLAECTGPGAAHRCKQAKETKERSNGSRTKGSYANADKAANDAAVEYGPSDDCHEKTVLRCTFCRREYHGPNAKSMWRRHVYDKHKVAMKNRREGSAGMAPRIPMPKKVRKVAESSQGTQGTSASLDTPALTLDLTNEQNLVRLLERVVSGNLDISLPGSLLESASTGASPPVINLQSIALALQKSGITVTLEKGAVSSPDVSSSDSASHADSAPNIKSNMRSSEGNDKNGQEDTPQTVSSPLGNSVTPCQVTNRSSSRVREGTGSGQKRKAAESDREDEDSGYPNCGRPPLTDQTAVDRSNHNAHNRPDTPRKDKGKQKAMPRTPGGPRMSAAVSPPESQNPFTPQRHPSATALRARALATTGEESYLTLVLSSPATMSPLRSVGRVSFTSPSRRNASPLKFKSHDGPQADGALGVLGASSPRYPFDFNIEGSEGSPSYLTAFDPIPLEVGNSQPSHWTSHWTPRGLGPPAPLSESVSRSISRVDSLVSGIDMDDEAGTDEEHELRYPQSSPSERLRRRHLGLESKLSDEDFDMEAFLDLADAGPEQEPNLPQSPHKVIGIRGFAKEFGLLSQEEVDRITASARPNFEEEARKSKRQKVDVIV